MSDTEAAKIAASLTEAQRRAILSASYQEGDGAWRFEGWYCAADKRVRWALCCLSLTRDYLCPANKLTELGLAVRAYLTGASDNA